MARRLAATVAATAVIAATAIPGAMAAAAVHQAGGRSPDAPAAARSAGNLPDSVQRVAEARFPGVYGSVRVTGPRHIDVYLTALKPAAEAAIRKAAATGDVTFRITPHTRLQLLAIHAKVTKDFSRLSRLGIHLVSWFPGINGNGVENIGVRNLTSRDTAILDRLLGAGNISVRSVARRGIPVLTVGRNSDYAPWNGGDNLTSNGYGCTSGAGINYGGTQYMMTAAHCFEPGWGIYNALAGQTGTYMGTEYSRDVANGGDDTALLSMPPNSHIWTGAIGSPAGVADTGSATNPDGDTVCNEGAYSGEVCSVVQNNYYGCISVSGYTGISGSRTECNIVEAESGGIANQDGDSGAPMIRYISGALKATGIVSAASDGPISCQYNSSTPTCYHIVYYTAMTEILSTEYPGATLVTG
jgi:hypothetical protein